MTFPAAALARHRLTQYGPPPLTAGRCADWVQRHYGATVLLGQPLPQRIRAHLAILPDVGALILVNSGSPWPRWSILHELAHLDTETTGPLAVMATYWQRVPYERIANRYAVELAAPPATVTALLRQGCTVADAARRLDVPEWVIERQAHGLSALVL